MHNWLKSWKCSTHSFSLFFCCLQKTEEKKQENTFPGFSWYRSSKPAFSAKIIPEFIWLMVLKIPNVYYKHAKISFLCQISMRWKTTARKTLAQLEELHGYTHWANAHQQYESRRLLCKLASSHANALITRLPQPTIYLYATSICPVYRVHLLCI